jgi:hypothetical protein
MTDKKDSKENPLGNNKPAAKGGDFKQLPLCGDYDIRIASDGSWFYQGGKINRPTLPKLFATVLSRADDGDYWLTTPYERGRVQVDDAPFAAVEIKEHNDDGTPIISFRTNLDDWVELGEDNPLRVEINPETGEPRPYILVRDRLEALVIRSAFYHLVDLATEENIGNEERLGIRSNDAFFPIDRHQTSSFD